MSRTGDKPPPRTAPTGLRQAAAPQAPRGEAKPREAIGRFFRALGRLESGPRRPDGEGAR